MKHRRIKRQVPDNGQPDPELDKDLAYLVKLGLIKEYHMNGEVIYGITEAGDKFVEETLLPKGNPSIADLP